MVVRGAQGVEWAQRAVAALVVVGIGLLGSADTGQAHARVRVRHAAPTTVCSVTDPRLTSISGMAASRGALYVVNDTSPVTVYRLGNRCQVVAATTLTIPAAHDPQATLRTSGDKEVDLEDVASGADGALWLGDIGGNTRVRSVISLYRWVPGTIQDAATAGEVVTRTEARIRRPNRVTRYDLRYPDGAHDAETLLVSLTGQVVVVTKSATGVAGIYAADLPLAPVVTLRRVGSLDLRGWLPGRSLSALAVTGGAVAPDGVHLALRTHGQALEWDAPDGDVVTALTTGVPRLIALGKAPQGEAIAYAESRPELLTEGEQLPAPLGSIALYREATAAPSAGPVFPPVVLAGAAAAGLLCIAIGTLAWRRREGGTR
jgi:hypothetical protein